MLIKFTAEQEVDILDLTKNYSSSLLWCGILRISKDSNLDEVNRDNYITKDNLSGIYISKNEFGKALPLVEENYTDCIKVKNKNMRISLFIK